MTAVRLASIALLSLALVVAASTVCTRRQPFEHLIDLPVQIAPGLLFSDAETARSLLGTPVQPADERALMVWPTGREAMVSTPAECLAALRDGAEPKTNYDVAYAQHLVALGLPAEIYLAARPARRSSVRGFRFDHIDPLTQIPATLGPAVSSDEIAAAAAAEATDDSGPQPTSAHGVHVERGRAAARRNGGVGAAFPTLRVARVAAHEVELTDGDTTIILRVLLWGDLAPARGADADDLMLWQVSLSTSSGTYRQQEFALVGRSLTGRLTVVGTTTR